MPRQPCGARGASSSREGHTIDRDLAHVLGLLGGTVLVVLVLISALKTVVLPTRGLTRITRFVFACAHRVFIRRRHGPFSERLAPLYAPVALVSLPFVWALCVTGGFTLVFWSLGDGNLSDSFVTSGSSLFTLGFEKPNTNGLIAVTFVEATIGLGLIALLISYLPTIYSSFSNREKGVAMLRPLTGTPPAAVELIRRMAFAEAVTSAQLWGKMSNWFADLEQSHTAFPALSSFAPQRADQSWISTGGSVLDAAALLISLQPPDERATSMEYLLLVAHGMPAMCRVARAAGLPIEDPPVLLEITARIGDEPPPLSVTRTEYVEAANALAASGIGVGADLDLGWRTFGWIRAGYDHAVRGLAGLAVSDDAPWTTDRPALVGRPRFFSRRPINVTW